MKPEPLRGPRPAPRRLGESLAGVVRRLGGPAPGVLDAVFGRWEEVVGAVMAAHSRPLSIRGATLVVAVEEPGWATELRYLAPSILARVADLAGPGAADRLEVRVKPGPAVRGDPRW